MTGQAVKSVLTPDVLAHIDRLVEAAPPFSQATLDRLAILLRPERRDVPTPIPQAPAA